MKKRLLHILIFLIIAGPALSQIPLVSYISTNGPAKYPTHIDSLGYGGFRVVKDTVERNAISTQRRKYGMSVYVQANDSLYILRDAALGNTNWFSFAPAGASADMSGYVKFSDTSTMLSPYLLKYYGLQYTDTAAMLSGYAKTGQTLKLSDTAAMLSNMLLRTDTSGMLSGYAKSGQILSLSDTVNMFAGYARTGQTLKLSDTTNMLLNLLRISDSSNMLSGYAKVGQFLKLSDSSVMLSNLLRRTDTATMLSGYAKAGQILSLSDTANMFAGFVRTGQTLKLSDTTNMLLNLLRLSDTSNMLSGYARAGQTVKYTDTFALVYNRLKVSDTAYMLSNRLRITDTVTMLSGYAKAGQFIKASDSSAMLSNLVRASDTSFMLSGYAKAEQKLNLSDTSSMLTNYGKADQLVKYSDTAAMFTGYRRNGVEADTFTSNIMVYSTFGLGKYATGQTIPAVGKTAMAVLIDALTQTISPTYIQPTVTVSSSPTAGTVEIGAALNITLTANFIQNDAGSQSSSSYSKNGSGLGSNTDAIASLTSAVTYTATVNYGQGGIKNNNLGTADPVGRINAGSKTSGVITFTPQSKRYWGYAATSSPTDAEIIAALGGGSELSATRAKASFDITISSGTHFIFFAYPASLGNLTSLNVGGFGSISSFTQTTRSFTNANSYAQSYNIYVNPNDFSTTVSSIITN
jgi:hypothetical protein